MALILGEQPIIDALNGAFSYFKANLTTLVPDIFAYANAQDKADIISLWSGSQFKYPPTVTMGYPMKPPDSPTVSVTNEPEKETNQYAGGAETGINLNGSPAHAGDFETVYNCFCFAVGHKQLLWLQVLVKWALLAQRIPLMQGITSAGLPTGYFQKQRLSASGVMPAPDLMQDSISVWQRIVSLTASHIDTWTDIQTYPIMVPGQMTITV